MDDMGTDAHEEVVHGVHIGALAGAEAHVVEPDAELLEALVTPGVLGADDADGRPPAPARRARPPLLARTIHELPSPMARTPLWTRVSARFAASIKNDSVSKRPEPPQP